VPPTYTVRLVNVELSAGLSMMAGMMTLILTGLLFALRTPRALVLETLALRHQPAVLQRAAPRPRLRTSDRLFWVLLSRLWSGWADAVSVVQPATVIRWQRSGFQLYWTWKSWRRCPGRPAHTEAWRVMDFWRLALPNEAPSAENVARFAVIHPGRFAGQSPETAVPPCERPGDLMVIVAGGPGKHSAIVPTFGPTRSVTAPIDG
jgi:hypothetical protein